MKCFVRALFAPALIAFALSAVLMAPTAANARSYYGSSSVWDNAEGTPRVFHGSADDEEESAQPRRKRHAKRHRDTRHAKPRRQRHQIARPRASDRRAAQHRKSTRKASVRTARRSTTPGWSKRSLSTAGPKGSGQLGIASYYWQPQRVAAGGWFNPNAMTAAHRSLPFGTRVRVTHLASGRSVEVKINDRGPYIRGRIIDLSKAAAGVLRMHEQGIARVSVLVLGR